jgi:hypothetical protein
MRLSNAEKLKMVLEHLEEGIPLHTLGARSILKLTKWLVFTFIRCLLPNSILII